LYRAGKRYRNAAAVANEPASPWALSACAAAARHAGYRLDAAVPAANPAPGLSRAAGAPAASAECAAMSAIACKHRLKPGGPKMLVP
jgi:hypothetical protein